jgi:hypothetical protein
MVAPTVALTAYVPSAPAEVDDAEEAESGAGNESVVNGVVKPRSRRGGRGKGHKNKHTLAAAQQQQAENYGAHNGAVVQAIAPGKGTVAGALERGTKENAPLNQLPHHFMLQSARRTLQAATQHMLPRAEAMSSA